MNLTEHLLTSLSEESSEITQAATKALRFGLNDRYPDDSSPSNQEKIIDELNDLMGVVRLLIEQGIITKDWMSEAKVSHKREKVLKYLHYAVDRGTLVGSAPVDVAIKALTEIRNLNSAGANDEFFIADNALKVISLSNANPKH